MGRPIKKTLFGNHNGGIKVSFHTGGSLYSGYIVKQESTHLFDVSDGTHTARCKLTAVAPGSLVDGQMCIAVLDSGNQTHYVAKLLKHVCVIESGATMPWAFTVPGAGHEQIADISDLAIQTQPSDVTGAGTGAATFTVAATGTGTKTYQWQVQVAGAGNWNNIDETNGYTTSTSATLHVTSATGKTTNKYRCVVTAGNDSVTSAAATLVS